MTWSRLSDPLNLAASDAVQIRVGDTESDITDGAPMEEGELVSDDEQTPLENAERRIERKEEVVKPKTLKVIVPEVGVGDGVGQFKGPKQPVFQRLGERRTWGRDARTGGTNGR